MALFGGGGTGGQSKVDIKVDDKHKAYMGDGFGGYGKFLEGVARAYLDIEIDEKVNKTSDITTNHAKKLDEVTDQTRHTDDLTKTVKHIDDLTNTVKHIDDLTKTVKHVDDLTKTVKHVDDFTETDRKTNTLTDYDEDVDRTQDRLTAEQKGILSEWLNAARDRFLSDEFKKENAKKDTDGAVKSIFDEYQKNFLPSVYSRQCRHGVYNDTTSQLLINDAFASTVIKGAKLQLDTISAYQSIMDKFSSELGQGLQIALGDMLTEHIDRAHIEDQDKVTHEERDQDIDTDETRDQDIDTDEVRDQDIDTTETRDQDVDTEETVDQDVDIVDEKTLDSDMSFKETQHQTSTTDTHSEESRTPNLLEFAKHAAVIELGMAVLKPYISRNYQDQHK